MSGARVPAAQVMGPRGVLVDAPQVSVAGDAVTLRGQALADVYWLARQGVEVAEVRDGIAPSVRLSGLLQVIRRTVEGSAVPVTEFRQEPGSAVSGVSERIGTREATYMLGCSERWVRSLSSELGGRKISGRWTYDRTLVGQRAAARAEEH